MQSVSKKGLMFSAGTLLSIIVGVILFTIGLHIIFKVVQRSESELDEIDKQIEEQVAMIMSQTGAKVVVPITERQGMPGQTLDFYVGIANYELHPDNFSLSVSDFYYYAPNGSRSNFPSGVNFNVQYYTDTFLMPNSYITRKVLITVPSTAVKGQYSFKVEVYNGTSELYGSTHTLIVTVG